MVLKLTPLAFSFKSDVAAIPALKSTAVVPNFNLFNLAFFNFSFLYALFSFTFKI